MTAFLGLSILCLDELPHWSHHDRHLLDDDPSVVCRGRRHSCWRLASVSSSAVIIALFTVNMIVIVCTIRVIIIFLIVFSPSFAQSTQIENRLCKYFTVNLPEHFWWSSLVSSSAHTIISCKQKITVFWTIHPAARPRSDRFRNVFVLIIISALSYCCTRIR